METVFEKRRMKLYETEKETYRTKVEQILNLAKAHKDVPVGKRLSTIAAAYHNRDAYNKTSCSTTDEIQIFSLILDRAGVDTTNLREIEPLLAAHYETFKQSGIDTKELYDVLEPELPMHFKRYRISNHQQQLGESVAA